MGTETGLEQVRQKTALGLVFHGHWRHRSFSAGDIATLFGIKMVLASAPREYLAASGDFQALSICFICFHILFLAFNQDAKSL